MHDRQCVGLVVVTRRMTFGTHGSDDLTLTGIAFTGCVLLDGSYRNALVGNVVEFAPRRELSEEGAVGMGSGRAFVCPHLLEYDPCERTGLDVKLTEPRREAQQRHTAALEAAGFEQFGAGGYGAAWVGQRPAGMLAEIQGQKGIGIGGLAEVR